MKISYEKTVHLSHVLIAALQNADAVDVIAEPNDIRNRMLAVLRDALRQDEDIEMRARRKITTQKRNIPEGGAEWEILFRKYYEEEIVRMGGG